MPLIDLKTDLKSLKFGSNGPYVVKDIENPNPSFIGSKEIYARIDDTIRIGRMLIDKPGITFAAKQAALLALDNNNTEGLKAAAKEVGKEVFNTLSTILKQVPVNGLGIHFTSTKEDGTYLGAFLKDDQGKYVSPLEGMKPSPFAPTTKRPLTAEQTALLWTEHDRKSWLGPIEDPASNDAFIKGLNPDVVSADRGNSKKSNPLLDIREHKKNREKDNVPLSKLVPEDTYDAIQEPNFITQETKVTELVDFRNNVRKDKPSDEVGKGTEERNTYALDYSSTEINKEFRVNLGNPGGRADRTDYFKTETVGQDGINMLDVGEGDGQGTGKARDLIKFKFRIITPDSSRVLYFRALLDSFDDSYSGSWNGTKYIGRAEDFQTYQGFSRELSVGFKIAAMTRQEMKPLYRKMTYLASATAPTYDTNGAFMRGTLAQMTVGSYIYEVPGIITSVKYSWDTQYPWEIAMQNPEGATDDDQQELPMIMNASVSFTPIHNFVPETGLKHYITNPTPQGGSRKFF